MNHARAGEVSHTRAIQNTDKHRAIVMAASFQALGYSKSSSALGSDVLPWTEFCSEVFSSAWFFSSRVGGSADVSRMEAAVDGMVLPTSFVSRTEGLTLWAAVFSESAILIGRSDSLFWSLIGDKVRWVFGVKLISGWWFVMNKAKKGSQVRRGKKEVEVV